MARTGAVGAHEFDLDFDNYHTVLPVEGESNADSTAQPVTDISNNSKTAQHSNSSAHQQQLSNISATLATAQQRQQECEEQQLNNVNKNVTS